MLWLMRIHPLRFKDTDTQLEEKLKAENNYDGSLALTEAESNFNRRM